MARYQSRLGVLVGGLLAGVSLTTATLAESRAGVEEVWTFVTPDHCDIFVREIGQGEPTLVLHGGPAANHEPLVGALAFLSRRSRLIFLDQRGSLRSRCPAEAELSVQKIVDDIEQLRRIRGFATVDVIRWRRLGESQRWDGF